MSHLKRETEESLMKDCLQSLGRVQGTSMVQRIILGLARVGSHYIP